MANEKRLIYLEDALSVMPALEMCTRALRNLPTVDAVEVVHGRWLVENEASIRCSECCFNRASIKMPLNYCPMCGAKMVG